jgi:hypothetical protein
MTLRERRRSHTHFTAIVRRFMSSSPDSLHARLLEALEQSDTWRRQGRAERIVWLSQHQVAYGVISGPMDTMRVLAEARDCFVEAHYVAALVLAVAFIEHALMDELQERNLDRRVGNLKVAIQRAADNSLFPSDLLSRAEGLRKIRNPFAHRRASGDPDSFGSRFLARNQHPDLILEADAKEALEVMYAFFRLTLKSA